MDDERRRFAAGLRFSTGTCLALVVVALALRSGGIVLAFSAIGLIAGSPPAIRSTTSGTTPPATSSAGLCCRPTRAAGVGNFLDLAAPQPAETVLELGSGLGM